MTSANHHILPVLAALILNDKNEILIAQRKSNISQGLKWEFPGGKLKSGETPESCLVREIQEELGIQIEINQIFTAVNHSYTDKNILLLAYLSNFIGGEFHLTDHIGVHWVQIQELAQYDLSDADYPIAEKLSGYFQNKQ